VRDDEASSGSRLGVDKQQEEANCTKEQQDTGVLTVNKVRVKETASKKKEAAEEAIKAMEIPQVDTYLPAQERELDGSPSKATKATIENENEAAGGVSEDMLVDKSAGSSSDAFFKAEMEVEPTESPLNGPVAAVRNETADDVMNTIAK
jgi:hypothetical protein